MQTLAKKEVVTIRLHLEAGKAAPGPPVGPILAPHGIDLPSFTKSYNEQTAAQAGYVIPVDVTIYNDRSFTMVLKRPPAANLLKRAAGIEKGSGVPNQEKVAQLTKEQVLEIAKQKMPDLNTTDEDMAVRILTGTARSMGIEVIDD